MRRLALLLLVLGLTTAAAPAQGGVLAIDPGVVPRGQLVNIVLENRSATTFYLRALLPPWYVYDSGNLMIYAPPALPVSTPIRPGIKYHWTWDQRDRYGAMVKAGTYEVRCFYDQNGSGWVTRARVVIEDVLLEIKGTVTPGARVPMTLTAAAGGGLTYRVGLSFATQPGIPLPVNRVLPLAPDALFALSMSMGGPLFEGFIGTLDGNGQAAAALHIPNHAALRGVTLYAAFAVFDPSANGGVLTFSAATKIRVE